MNGYIFNSYGFVDNPDFETFPEERRNWRKHIEQHIDEKTAEAIETINAYTDERMAQAEEHIDETVETNVNAAVNTIKGIIGLNNTTVAQKFANIEALIGQPQSDGTSTLFGAIKYYRYHI